MANETPWTISAPQKRVFLGVLVATLVIATTAFLNRPVETCADAGKLEQFLTVPGTHSITSVRDVGQDRVFKKVVGVLSADPKNLVFSMLRGHRASTLSANWVRYVSLSLDPEREWRESIDVDGETYPVGMAEAQLPGLTYRVARVAFRGDEPVDSLIASQLSSAFSQLVQGTQPLTILMIEMLANSNQINEREAAGVEWLGEAIRHYRKSCRRT